MLVYLGVHVVSVPLLRCQAAEHETRDTQLNRKSIIIPRDRFEISSRLTIQIHIFMFGAGRHEIY